MESYSKKGLCCGNPFGGRGSLRATSSLCPLDFVHMFVFFLVLFFFKSRGLCSELRGSSGCGRLPRYVARNSHVTVFFSCFFLPSNDENKSQCHGSEPMTPVEKIPGEISER